MCLTYLAKSSASSFSSSEEIEFVIRGIFRILFITIQTWWKFHFVLTLILRKFLHICHGMCKSDAGIFYPEMI